MFLVTDPEFKPRRSPSKVEVVNNGVKAKSLGREGLMTASHSSTDR